MNTNHTPNKNKLTPVNQLENIVHFLFEAGMLRHVPRSGYPLLGTGKENVAEHSYRTAIIGYILAKESGAKASHTSVLCLFHDLPETRTGDLNYLHQLYVEDKAKKALEDAVSDTSVGNSILELWEEYTECITTESILAHDADQLDLALNLRVEENLGNPYAQKWLKNLSKRLKSKIAKELYKLILVADHNAWWYEQKHPSWWETRCTNKEHSS